MRLNPHSPIIAILPLSLLLWAGLIFLGCSIVEALK
jgi:TRAP-type C4-dicarboxylate transport system permease small subunit